MVHPVVLASLIEKSISYWTDLNAKNEYKEKVEQLEAVVTSLTEKVKKLHERLVIAATLLLKKEDVH